MYSLLICLAMEANICIEWDVSRKHPKFEQAIDCHRVRREMILKGVDGNSNQCVDDDFVDEALKTSGKFRAT